MARVESNAFARAGRMPTGRGPWALGKGDCRKKCKDWKFCNAPPCRRELNNREIASIPASNLAQSLFKAHGPRPVGIFRAGIGPLRSEQDGFPDSGAKTA